MSIDGWKRWADVPPGYWFAPKPFGLGATPVTWQGWTLVIGFAVLLLLDIRLVESVPAKIVIGVALTIALVVISWRKTEGGWHWHWGPPD